MIPHTIRPLDGWAGERTPDRRRKRSPFSATWTDTLALLDRELHALGAPASAPWVLQLDVPAEGIRLDGKLRAGVSPDTPAVRISFASQHGPMTYQCDRYKPWQANARAIGLALEALRKVDRYGITSRGEQYQGFAAIEAGPNAARLAAASLIAEWAEPEQTEKREALARILPSSDATSRMIADAYRAAARRAHPDRGGDDETMARLTAARDLLMGATR